MGKNRILERPTWILLPTNGTKDQKIHYQIREYDKNTDIIFGSDKEDFSNEIHHMFVLWRRWRPNRDSSFIVSKHNNRENAPRRESGKDSEKLQEGNVSQIEKTKRPSLGDPKTLKETSKTNEIGNQNQWKRYQWMYDEVLKKK